MSSPILKVFYFAYCVKIISKQSGAVNIIDFYAEIWLNINKGYEGDDLMKFTFNGKNLSLTDALKNRTISKISKLKRFFKDEVNVFVTMEVQKNIHKMEVTIPYQGVVFRAEASSGDMYTSLDKVVDIIERQFRKNKTRLQKKLHISPSDFSKYIKSSGVDEAEEKNFNIKKVKRFVIKPMDVEEAILQMNLLGHQFFVFSNAESGEVNVVYKRKDGDYGLIEPEY